VTAALLEIDGLRVEIGAVLAVRGVSFSVGEGARVGVVGESGSGKSMTAAAIMGLLPRDARVTEGSTTFAGRPLQELGEEELRRLRGAEIGMIFQNAKAALNPVFSVGEQIADVYRLHAGAKPEDAWERAVELLDEMGIPDARERATAYPHEFSGGQAQRAMIAMALICSPRMLIADEPTTGLDATIEAQVLDLIADRVERGGAALLLISHDLGVIRSACREVVVMYAGEVFEAGPIDVVLDRPANPYTRLLLASAELDRGAVTYIPGQAPDLRAEPAGCAFADRCPLAVEKCRTTAPRLRRLGDGRLVTCHRAEECRDGLA
jgi:oligopeptide/dipeptide ABC transporter ATP-binding protein